MNPGQEIPLVVKDLKVVKNFIWDAYTKWYHLGVELELDPSDLEAIRTKFNNDPAECFNQVLLDWLMGKGSACTWKNLATALKAPPIKFSSLSEGIEKKYCKAGARSSCSNCPTKSNKISAEVEALFPYLSKDMPEHIRTNLIFHLSKETDDIKNKFIALETRLRRALKLEATAEEIIRIIARKGYKFHKAFKDCDTGDKLLDEAEQHWSFFDYDLIQLLIGCIFEDEHHLMIQLKVYAADFKEYAKRRICECPSNVFEDQKKNGKVMVFKIEKRNFETMTVDELKKLCFCLNSAVISSYNLRLLKTDPGCIQLTFRAMPSADDMIKKLTREEQQALRKMGVLSITYVEETLNLVSLFGEMAEHEDDKEIAKNSTSDPPSSTLSLEEPMAVLQVKGDNDADSVFGMISDTTGKSVATHSTYGGNILTSGLGTDISDESKNLAKLGVQGNNPLAALGNILKRNSSGRGSLTRKSSKKSLQDSTNTPSPKVKKKTSLEAPSFASRFGSEPPQSKSPPKSPKSGSLRGLRRSSSKNKQKKNGDSDDLQSDTSSIVSMPIQSTLDETTEPMEISPTTSPSKSSEKLARGKSTPEPSQSMNGTGGGDDISPLSTVSVQHVPLRDKPSSSPLSSTLSNRKTTDSAIFREGTVEALFRSDSNLFDSSELDALWGKKKERSLKESQTTPERNNDSRDPLSPSRKPDADKSKGSKKDSFLSISPLPSKPDIKRTSISSPKPGIREQLHHYESNSKVSSKDDDTPLTSTPIIELKTDMETKTTEVKKKSDLLFEEEDDELLGTTTKVKSTTEEDVDKKAKLFDDDVIKVTDEAIDESTSEEVTKTDTPAAEVEESTAASSEVKEKSSSDQKGKDAPVSPTKSSVEKAKVPSKDDKPKINVSTDVDSKPSWITELKKRRQVKGNEGTSSASPKEEAIPEWKKKALERKKKAEAATTSTRNTSSPRQGRKSPSKTPSAGRNSPLSDRKSTTASSKISESKLKTDSHSNADEMIKSDTYADETDAKKKSSDVVKESLSSSTVVQPTTKAKISDSKSPTSRPKFKSWREREKEARELAEKQRTEAKESRYKTRREREREAQLQEEKKETEEKADAETTEVKSSYKTRRERKREQKEKEEKKKLENGDAMSSYKTRREREREEREKSGVTASTYKTRRQREREAKEKEEKEKGESKSEESIEVPDGSPSRSSKPTSPTHVKAPNSEASSNKSSVSSERDTNESSRPYQSHGQTFSTSRSPTPPPTGPLKLTDSGSVPEWKRKLMERKKSGSSPVHKTPPVKVEVKDDIPEWKKNLLAKKKNKGDDKDGPRSKRSITVGAGPTSSPRSSPRSTASSRRNKEPAKTLDFMKEFQSRKQQRNT